MKSDTNWFVPAFLTTSYACPADMHADVHFQCGNGQFIDKVDMCNGIDNCGDSSDEAHCSGAIQVGNQRPHNHSGVFAAAHRSLP